MSDDLTAIIRLDQELDELVAGGAGARQPQAEGEVPALASLAVALRDEIPEPAPAAAERGRAAFLAEVDRSRRWSGGGGRSAGCCCGPRPWPPLCC
jgi:hypothetical protein